jgi:fructokinase
VRFYEDREGMHCVHLVCGEALYDIFVDGDSASDNGEITLHAFSGGSPFNIAIGLARLGLPVALATEVANDVLGERLISRLAAEGVSDWFVRRTAPNTALAFVTLGDEGAPSYHFSGLRDAAFAPESRSVVEQMNEITNLHLGSVALVLPQSSAPLRDLARDLCGQLLISLDPNVRLAVEPDPARWREAIESIRPYAHVVKVSEEDVALAYGSNVEPEQLCQRWLSDGTELVVLTRGNRGSTMFARTGRPLAIPALAVPVADTVGAGDSFMAALLAGLARSGASTPEAIAGKDAAALKNLGNYASAAAALTCSRRGPSLPRLNELERLAARFWSETESVV